MNDLLTLIFSRFVLFNCPSFIDLGDLYAYIVAFTKLKIVYFMFVVVFVIFFTDRQHADKITTLKHKKRVNCCKRTIINRYSPRKERKVGCNLCQLQKLTLLGIKICHKFCFSII